MHKAALLIEILQDKERKVHSELSSSGFVISDLASEDGEPRTEATYLLQLSSGAVKLVLAEIVGQSRALVLSFAKLRTLAEAEAKFKSKP